MPSPFDPGHGPFSSIEEWAVAVVAFVILAVAGAVLVRVRDAKGLGVLGVAVGVAVAVAVAAPPVFADEWHYVFVGAIPVVVLVWLYRGRRE